MNIRDLEAILLVYKEKNLSVAAQKLYITQPALSKIVMKVEKFYNVTIFDKRNLPWQLTYAGEIFIRKAKKIVDYHEELQQDLKQISNLNNKEIRIAFMFFEEKVFLPKIISTFKEKYPHVKIKNIHLSSKIVTDLETTILNGQTTFAVVVLPLTHTGIEFKPIKTYSFLLALPKNHPLAKNYKATKDISKLETLDLALLKNDSFILLHQGNSFRNVAIDLCLKAGFTPQIASETYNFDSINSFVSNGTGVSIVLDEMMKIYNNEQNIAYFKIKNNNIKKSDLMQTIAFAYKEGYKLNDIEKDLLKLMKKSI